MGAALEIFIIPVILVTLLVLVLLGTSLSAASILASAVFLGLLYFAVIKLLGQLRRADRQAEEEDRAEIHRAEVAAHRD